MDRFNRLLLLAVGFALAAAGGSGLAAAWGRLDLLQPSAVFARLVEQARAEPLLWRAGTLAVGAILALLGLALAWRELAARPGGRLATVELDGRGPGRTQLAAVAVAEAVDHDLARVGGVATSRTRLVAFRPQPHLLIRLDLDDQADLAAVRADAEQVYARRCRSLGVDQVRADVLLRPGMHPGPRVR